MSCGPVAHIYVPSRHTHMLPAFDDYDNDDDDPPYSLLYVAWHGMLFGTWPNLYTIEIKSKFSTKKS